MGWISPFREPRLTRVTKSYGDAICHCVNWWECWPLQTTKSSKNVWVRMRRDTDTWFQAGNLLFLWIFVLSSTQVTTVPGVNHTVDVALSIFRKKFQNDFLLCAGCTLCFLLAWDVAVVNVRLVQLCMELAVGGHTRLGSWHWRTAPGSLSIAVSDRTRQLVDPFHVGITACSDVERKTSAVLCGKTELWVP